jgi:hypothetical protein
MVFRPLFERRPSRSFSQVLTFGASPEQGEIELDRRGGRADLSFLSLLTLRKREIVSRLSETTRGAFCRACGFDLTGHGLLNSGMMTFDFQVEWRVRERLAQGF